MRATNDGALIQDFLGSAHIFASAVNDVVEKQLLKEVSRDLTPSQFKLLQMVALTDAQTISDVALFLRVSSAAASKAVDKLVRRHLLRREEGHPDRREIRLSLTGASRKLLGAHQGLRHRRLTKIFRQFPAAELRRTAELLARLSADLVDHGEKPDEVCLQCGIYFRERCLVRQLVDRNCFYLRHKASRARAATGRA